MPLLFTKNISSAVLGVWKMQESESELLAMLPHADFYLRELSHRRLASCRRQEYLSVRILLHQLLADASVIAYHPSGKPFLADSTAHISISHTKGYVAVIIDSIHEVGIDIEQRTSRVLRVKSRFLNSAELSSVDEQNEISYCLICWSAKETLYKVMPEQSPDFVAHLHLYPFAVDESGSVTSYETYSKNQRIYKIDYLQHSDFVLTYVIDSDRHD